MNYFVDSNGYYGQFGGAYMPETLYSNVEELKSKYLPIIESAPFKEQFEKLLKDYVGRPTPLYRASRLSEMLGFTVYFKREDLTHTGAHKINNALGQVLLARELGRHRIIAETGAGQHGVATATACALLGLECIVYMGERDIARQAPNVLRMQMLGAKVVCVTSGSKTLKDATNEAIRDWMANPTTTHYAIGSVVGPHPYPDLVARFQSVISYEIRSQLESEIGSPNPNYVVACVGGGSNAIGAFYHYLDQPLVKLIGVEAAGFGLDTGKSAATLTLGRAGVLHGSRTVLLQTEDGQIAEAHSISAGLDYPGVGPQHAHLKETNRAQFVSVTDAQALEGAKLCARLEGIIPALESAHAIFHLTRLGAQKDEIVVLNLSGRGDKDLAAYSEHIIAGDKNEK
jgi:tryptophan synthase beta chain